MVKYSFLFVLLAGCNNFKTLAEACEEEIPSLGNITDSGDRGAALRLNCYRRLANVSALNVDELPQKALEQHMSYLEQNTPDLNIFNQFPNNPSFVGSTVLDRLKAAQYTMPYGAQAAELAFIGVGEMEISPEDVMDLVMTDPFSRSAFLIASTNSISLGHAKYTITYPEESDLPSETRNIYYYTVIHTLPDTPYQEPAIIYPRNGQQDVPPQYTQYVVGKPIDPGEIHGFPITFTVGPAEGPVTLESASLIGPNGPLEIRTFSGAEASSESFQNNAIIIPEVPLLVGQTYQANVVLSTSFGTQNEKTEFTVSSEILGDPF